MTIESFEIPVWLLLTVGILLGVTAYALVGSVFAALHCRYGVKHGFDDPLSCGVICGIFWPIVTSAIVLYFVLMYTLFLPARLMFRYLTKD